MVESAVVNKLSPYKYCFCFIVPSFAYFWQYIYWLPDRGLISAEYILLGALSHIINRYVVAATFSLLAFLDIIFSIGRSFFFSPLQSIKSLSFIASINNDLTHSLAWATFLFLLFAIIWTLGYIGASNSNRKASIFLLSVFFIGYCGDLLNDKLSGDGRRIISVNIMSSSALHVAKDFNFYMNRLLRPFDLAEPSVKSMQSATATYVEKILLAINDKKAINDKNIVLIIVESLGQPINKKYRELLFSEIYQLEENFHVINHLTPFHGATTAAEMRELCYSAMDYRAMLLNPHLGENCLPQLLKSNGYRTTAVHGFSGSMFDRAAWWPLVGFDELIFAEHFPSTTSRCGGSFRGICDVDALDRITGYLGSPGHFIYLLTLNSHFPFPSNLKLNFSELCKQLEFPNASSECAHFGLLKLLFQKIAKIISETSTRTDWIIVGDHAPPFLLSSQRQHFEKDVVPFFLIHAK